MRHLNKIGKFVGIVILTAAPLVAQWIKQPTLGIPRTADGKPNLTAAAPRLADGKPDLSGLWRIDGGAYSGNVLADIKSSDVQPWADSLYKERMEDLGKDGPTVTCLPAGPVSLYGGTMLNAMVKMIHTPGLIVALFEDLTYRQIFLDGRALPKDPNPAWMGYSVGHWDGGTLVVETSGFNERSWLDFGGHPHTEALKVTERLRRIDFGHLEVEITLEDAKVYSKPWTIKVKGDLSPDTEMIEYVCNENEKDFSHLVGKASDDKKYAIKLPRDVLAAYVGSYEFRFPDFPDMIIPINVTLVGDELMIDFAGKDPMPLLAFTPTAFGGMGARMEFVKDDKGEVTHMVFQIVEGDLKGVRKK